MIIQLDPMLPVFIEKLGTGFAFAMIDYSQEHYVHFVIALDSDGSIWVLPNRNVKLQKNISIGRTLEKETKEWVKPHI